MVELNERAFPYTVGLDLNTEGEEKYMVTFSYPNINALGDQSIDDELVHVISTRGNSIFDATEELTKQLYHPLHFKHLKVIVMSRQVSQNKQMLLEILDGIQRDFVTNNNATLLIADSAKELIDFTTESTIQQAIDGTIYSLLINNQHSTYFTPIATSNFIQDMDQTGASIIPLSRFEENIIVEGGAIFKDYEYVGDISPEENRAIAILNNDVDNVNVDLEHGGYVLSLIMTESKTKKKLVDKKNLKMEFHITLEGHIHSHILDEEHHIDNEEILGELEEDAVKLIKGDIDAVIKKLQRDLNSDVIFVSDYLRKFHPNIWEEIEDDYDGIFPHIDIETKVDVFVRRRGLVM